MNIKKIFYAIIFIGSICPMKKGEDLFGNRRDSFEENEYFKKQQGIHGTKPNEFVVQHQKDYDCFPDEDKEEIDEEIDALKNKAVLFLKKNRNYITLEEGINAVEDEKRKTLASKHKYSGDVAFNINSKQLNRVYDKASKVTFDEKNYINTEDKEQLILIQKSQEIRKNIEKILEEKNIKGVDISLIYNESDFDNYKELSKDDLQKVKKLWNLLSPTINKELDGLPLKPNDEKEKIICDNSKCELRDLIPLNTLMTIGLYDILKKDSKLALLLSKKSNKTELFFGLNSLIMNYIEHLSSNNNHGLIEFFDLAMGFIVGIELSRLPGDYLPVFYIIDEAGDIVAIIRFGKHDQHYQIEVYDKDYLNLRENTVTKPIATIFLKRMIQGNQGFKENQNNASGMKVEKYDTKKLSGASQNKLKEILYFLIKDHICEFTDEKNKIESFKSGILLFFQGMVFNKNFANKLTQYLLLTSDGNKLFWDIEGILKVIASQLK